MTEQQQAEIRSILQQMVVLSESPGASFILSGVSGGKKQSSGTAGPGRRDGDQPLIDKWAQRFADPDNEPRLPTLILLAKRELAQRTHRSPVPVGENGEREDSWERDSRIIDWYENVPAEEAAIMESAAGTYCPASNIRSVRRRNERDPELGLAQAVGDRGKAMARELRAQDPRRWTVRKIARELNVAASTVQRYLATDEDERLAA